MNLSSPTDAASSRARSRRLVTLIVAAAVILLSLIFAAGEFWFPIREARAGYRSALEEYKGAGGLTDPLALAAEPLPSGRNAAELYLRAFDLTPADFESYTEDRSRAPFKDDDRLLDHRRREFDPGEWEAAEAAIRQYAAQIELLIKAASAGTCRYPVKYDDGWKTSLPHIALGLAAERLLATDIRFRVRKGNLDDVWERLDALFAVGESFAAEAFLVSQFARLLVAERGLELLEEILPLQAPGPDWRSRLDLRLRAQRDPGPLRRSCLFELSMTVDTMEKYFRGEPTHTGAETDMSWITRKLSLARVFEGGARCLSRLRRIRLDLDLPFAERIARASAVLDEFNDDPLSFAFIIPSYPKVWKRHLFIATRSLLACEAIKLRCSHSLEALPPTFEELPLDPAFGRPLRYRRTGAGFVLGVAAESEEIHALLDLGDPLEWRCPR